MAGCCARLLRGLVALVLLVGVDRVEGCGWETKLAPSGTLFPDTLVQVHTDGMGWYPFYGKIASFGSCPPKSSEASTQLLLKAYSVGSRIHAPEILPSHGCNALEPAKGEALLVLRGGCNFINKTLAAIDAGATALIVANAGPRMDSETRVVIMGCPRDYTAACQNVSIPTVMLSARDVRVLHNWHKEMREMQIRISALPMPNPDTAWAAMWALASVVTVGSAYVSVKGSPPGQPSVELRMEPSEVGAVHAGGLIIVSSMVLMLCLFFLQDVLIVILVLFALLAAFCMTVIGSRALRWAFRPLSYQVDFPLWEPTSVAAIVLLPLAMLLGSFWFWNRGQALSWVLHDILTASICCYIICEFKFASGKTAAQLLFVAVVYDMFWVLVSPMIFSQNAVVSALTTGNEPRPVPTTEIDRILSVQHTDTMPFHLVIPQPKYGVEEHRGLGIGSIIMPGMLMSLALRADHIKKSKTFNGYFFASSAGFVLGLSMAIPMFFSRREPGPFLAIVVPACVVPLFVLAWFRGQVLELWTGNIDENPQYQRDNVTTQGSGPGSEDQHAQHIDVNQARAAEDGEIEMTDMGGRNSRPGPGSDLEANELSEETLENEANGRSQLQGHEDVLRNQEIQVQGESRDEDALESRRCRVHSSMVQERDFSEESADGGTASPNDVRIEDNNADREAGSEARSDQWTHDRKERRKSEGGTSRENARRASSGGQGARRLSSGGGLDWATREDEQDDKRGLLS